MNTYSQLQKGLNETNAYSMLKNNTLFNESERETSESTLEAEKKRRIELLSFMQLQPRNWKFDLSHQNPF